MKLFEAQRYVLREMREAGLGEAEAQSRQLFFGVLNLSARDYLLLHDREVTQTQETLLREALYRRLSGEPLQYILGHWNFMGREFVCAPGALIPREDTQSLVDCALSLMGERNQRIADLGTGTGIIAVTLALENPLCRAEGVDMSPEALKIARENAERLHAENLEFSLGDMREMLPHGPYDGIVSNPPYIRTEELPGLQKELSWEPVLALDGGPDGLDFYRCLAERFSDSLVPGGWMALEVGQGQAEAVARMLEKDAECVRIEKDDWGIERVVAAVRKGTSHGIDG